MGSLNQRKEFADFNFLYTVDFVTYFKIQIYHIALRICRNADSSYSSPFLFI